MSSVQNMRSLPPARIANGPLSHMKAIAMIVAIACAAFTAVSILTGPAGAALGTAAIVAAGVLSAHWAAGWRHDRFSPLLELPELAALALVTHASTGQPLLLLFAVLLRSFYGPVALVLARTALTIATLLLATAGPVSDHGGEVVGLVLAAALVLALREALGRYEAGERRLRSLVSNAADAILIVDRTGEIAWSTDSATTVLGHDAASLRGLRFSDLVHADDTPPRLPPPSFTPLTMAMRLRAGDGSYREIEAVVADCTGDDAVRGTVLTLRDRTEHRRLERERADLALMRERVAAEQARNELELRLERAQRLESVGQLAGGIAHDFNNLLTVIRNYTDFVAAELGDGHELADDLREVRNAAVRGERLTNRLLAFGQRRVSVPSRLDTGKVIGELEGLLRGAVDGAVTIDYRIDEELWPVEFDPVSLEQIVVNAVINARDALDEGGGTITIAAANVRADGAYVSLSIADDGCGMDAATLARIREPFFTTKAPDKGTGLGLTTIDDIVAGASGCRLTIDSTPGHGTVLEVLIPASVEILAVDDAAIPCGRGEHVLVVDDEDAVRSVTAKILRRAGYTVTAADSGATALACVWSSAEAIALVLSDIVMPEMTGLELAAQLRNTRPELPVVLMSGYSDALLDPEEPLAGAVLTKPFDSDALLARVAAALAPTPLPASGSDAR